MWLTCISDCSRSTGRAYARRRADALILELPDRADAVRYRYRGVVAAAIRQSYVETLGVGAVQPLCFSKYAPVEERFQHIIARLEKVPVSSTRRAGSFSPRLRCGSEWRRKRTTGTNRTCRQNLRDATPASLKAHTTKRRTRPRFPARLQSLPHNGTAAKRRGFGRPGNWREGGTARTDWRLGPINTPPSSSWRSPPDRTPDQVLADAEAR